MSRTATNTNSTPSCPAPVRRGMITAAAATAAIAAAIATSARADLTDTTATYVNANVDGGEWGFLLKQVNGPVLADVNGDYLYYPASSIKVVQHVHAMLEVEAPNGTTLFTNMLVYQTENEACDDNHAGQIPNILSLSDTLEAMMEDSDNTATNSVQEQWGRAAINATAHDVIGMSADTQLNHKFGGDCGGPQDGQNQMPLADAVLLYERVAAGEIFADENTRDSFYTLMLNNGYFDDLVEEEAPEGMTVFDRQQFRNAVRHAWKGGSWAEQYKSVAGWVELPAPPCSGEGPTAYAFGVFLEQWDDMSEGFGTQPVVYEMLRDIFRQALVDYQLCLACGSGGPCDEMAQGVGCNDSACCEQVCAQDTLCCTVAWDATCVAAAINLCDLAPDNDDCADAAPASDGWNDFDISNAANDGPSHPGCDWNTEFYKDIWFDYTASCTGQLRVQSCSDFQTLVAVYEGAGCPQGENTLLDCNVQEADGCSFFGVCVTEGQSYKIRIAAGNPTQGTGQFNLTCGPNGYDNDGPGENGLGMANQVLAADFTMPCGGSPGWLNLKAIVPGGGGPDSTFQWFLFEPSAVGGPGTLIQQGTTIPIDIVALPPAGSSTPDSFFDITFALDVPPVLEADTTYWLGFSAPTMTFAAASETEGATAFVQNATGWTPVAGDLAINVHEFAPDDTTDCPGDTNGDGIVDVADLVNVVLAWGTSGAAAPGDANLDGAVDVQDLVLVILSWGPCV